MNATIYSVARLDVAAPSALTWVTVALAARGRRRDVLGLADPLVATHPRVGEDQFTRRRRVMPSRP